MKTFIPSPLSLALGLFLSATVIAVPAIAAESMATYQVTITNVTRGQVITPPVLFSHQQDFQFFTPGAPASAELTRLAEDGNSADLVAYLESQSGVHAVTTGSDAILPGASLTLEIHAAKGFRHLSAAGMLASSNDGFFALRGVRAPNQGTLAVTAIAYDAGTEANSESCAFIPGPPCGNPEVRDTDGAEGFVHVHAGIHGIGDLSAAEMDWRNPVVEIAIQRLPAE